MLPDRTPVRISRSSPPAIRRIRSEPDVVTVRSSGRSRGERDRIGPAAVGDPRRPVAPDETVEVIPEAAVEEVVARPAGQRVVAPRRQRACRTPAPPMQAVVAVATLDRIVAARAVDRVRPRRTEETLRQLRAEGGQRRGARGGPDRPVRKGDLLDGPPGVAVGAQNLHPVPVPRICRIKIGSVALGDDHVAGGDARWRTRAGPPRPRRRSGSARRRAHEIEVVALSPEEGNRCPRRPRACRRPRHPNSISRPAPPKQRIVAAAPLAGRRRAFRSACRR